MAMNYSMSAGGNPHLDNLTPEQRAQFMQLSPEAQDEFIRLLTTDYGGRAAVAEDEMSRADALRFNPQAQGRRARGVYVAASPLEHIADVLRHRKGTKDFEAARQRRDTAMSRQDELRRRIADQTAMRSGALRGL